MKRTLIEVCDLIIATMALAVIILSFSYILGIDVLSRIISGMPEPLRLDREFIMGERVHGCCERLLDLIKGGILIDTIKICAKIEIQTLRNILNLLEYLPEFWKQVRGFSVEIVVFDNFSFAVVVTFLNGKGEPICGSVAFNNGDRYVWKLVNSVYYVLIKGEWVPVEDPEWRPGKPLPPGG